MSKKVAITGVVAAMLMAGSTLSASAQQCPTGELTVERLASEVCLDRIPLPAEKPADLTEAGGDRNELRIDPQANDEVRYVEYRNDDGSTMRVRLVGPRFLPDSDRDREFTEVMHRPAETSGWRDTVFAAASWFGVTSAQAETGQPAQEVASSH
jgi:hypothetical protein